jgi:hypothetical protein
MVFMLTSVMVFLLNMALINHSLFNMVRVPTNPNPNPNAL